MDKLKGNEGLAAKTILGLDQSILMWIKEPDGWVLGTEAGSPPITNVEEVLKQDNQLKSDVFIDNEEFEVWSKLTTSKVNNKETIENKLGIILSREAENNWWGETLAALQERQEKGLQRRQSQLEMLNPKEKIQPWIQVALNEKQSQKLVNHWNPWRLLQSIAGSSLKPVLKGLAISIDPDLAPNDSCLNLRASIQIG